MNTTRSNTADKSVLFACRSIPPYSGISVSSSGYVVGCHIAYTT
jgi:hypothetical protein